MAAQLPDTTTTVPPPQPSLPSMVSSRRLKRQKAARALRLWVPAGLLILLLFLCFVWPYIYTIPQGNAGSILESSLPPFSPGHWLGIDANGVDIFSMLVYGGQVSFEISLAVTAVGIIIGGIIGLAAGYFGGWTDSVLSRVIDVLIAFPALVLVLAIAEVLGPSELHLIWALSAFSIPAQARIFRGATMIARHAPYITAARLSGTGLRKRAEELFEAFGLTDAASRQVLRAVLPARDHGDRGTHDHDVHRRGGQLRYPQGQLRPPPHAVDLASGTDGRLPAGRPVPLHGGLHGSGWASASALTAGQPGRSSACSCWWPSRSPSPGCSLRWAW